MSLEGIPSTSWQGKLLLIGLSLGWDSPVATLYAKGVEGTDKALSPAPALRPSVMRLFYVPEALSLQSRAGMWWLFYSPYHALCP